jgi:hypothetical protein
VAGSGSHNSKGATDLKNIIRQATNIKLTQLEPEGAEHRTARELNHSINFLRNQAQGESDGVTPQRAHFLFPTLVHVVFCPFRFMLLYRCTPFLEKCASLSQRSIALLKLFEFVRTVFVLDPSQCSVVAQSERLLEKVKVRLMIKIVHQPSFYLFPLPAS